MRVTRRQFTTLATAASLVPQIVRPASATPLFPRPDVIRYDAACFTIHGVDTFIFSLECPYPRILPDEWPDRFTKIRQAGFNTIDTYVFWNYHERDYGRFDFSELERFLLLAKKFGFYVILRPGPYVDAEFERGGLPAYVIARRIPIRSMAPDSLAVSKHWYDNVLPVIRRHQITEGGPVIMMQIENEIDFTDVPDTEQREYLRFLARLAWQSGIEVPLISNVSTAARDRADPDMSRILDACDFYPRWSFLTDNELPAAGTPMTMEEKVGMSDRAVLASLRKMRRDEPTAPLSVAELGTGYYSKFGGKLAEDEDGADATELNALSKTIIAQGVTYLNYYLGWGGTNFDFPAKTVTTTYDFAAPIREGGGLWEKYYTVHGVGAFLRMFGQSLARAAVLENGVSCTHPDITVCCRSTTGSAFLFVRTNTESEHHFQLGFKDPRGGSDFAVPLHGRLTMGPRAMKIMPVQVQAGGVDLRYCTAELLAFGNSGRQPYLVVYDEPDSLVELALAAEAEIPVTGDFDYATWLERKAAMVVGLRIRGAVHVVQVGGVLVIAVPRSRALRSWTAPAGEHLIPFITDAYLMTPVPGGKGSVEVDIDYLPGEHRLDMLLPSSPKRIDVDGVQTQTASQVGGALTPVSIDIPKFPFSTIDVKTCQTWREALETSEGEWISVSGKSLDDLAPLPYGYVKYRTRLTYAGEVHAFISALGANPKKVFVNGRFVPDASVPDRFVTFPASSWFHPGDNRVDIVYEQFGSNEFGETPRLIERNGLDRAGFDAGNLDDHTSTRWDVQLRPLPVRGRELDPLFAYPGSQSVRLPGNLGTTDILPGFVWCRADFSIPETPGWSVPWRLEFAAGRDALFYLNGAFVGRFVSAGPEFEFYLPSPLLRKGKGVNTLTIQLAYTDSSDCITTLRISPGLEHAAARRRVSVYW